MVFHFISNILHHWVNDHIIFSQSSEHRVVALGLSGFICGSFLWFVFLMITEGRRWICRARVGAAVHKSRRPSRRGPSGCKACHAPVSHSVRGAGRRRLLRSTATAATLDRKSYLRQRKGFCSDVTNRLTTYDLQRRQLTLCPDQVGYAGNNLVQVNLSHNALETIPDSFVCLRGLRSLRLEYNRLRELPACLGSLPSLEELNLSNNCLDRVPDCIQHLSTLYSLDLSHNRLDNLPDVSHARLDRLQVLRLGHNELRLLPASFGSLTSLRVLKLSHNKLQVLPDIWSGLIHLERLDLSHNLIHSLSPRIQLCCSLRVLQLCNNRLCVLPAGLFNLFKLAFLDVSFNQLNFLPKSMMYISLAELLAVGNPWQEREKTGSWPGPVSGCRGRQERLLSSPPSLHHLASVVVVEEGEWRAEQIPASVHEYLVRCERCVLCSELVFPPHCCRRIGFVRWRADLLLPFADVTCPSTDPDWRPGSVFSLFPPNNFVT